MDWNVMCKCILRPHCTTSYPNDPTHDLHAPPRCFSDCRLRCLTLAECFPMTVLGNAACKHVLRLLRIHRRKSEALADRLYLNKAASRASNTGMSYVHPHGATGLPVMGPAGGKCSPNRSYRRQATLYGTGTRSHRGDMEGPANSKPVATCL